MMDGKKISFSLNKIVKKPIIKTAIKKINDHELIECLEGQSIKIVGKDQNIKPTLLVIPLKNDQKTTTSRALMALQIIREEQGIEPVNVESDSVQNEGKKNVICTNETLDQKAAREILNSLKTEDVENETKVFSLPLKPEDLPLDGAKEATLVDYENIPIQDFGMAMLRGMGYVDEPKKKIDKLAQLPVLRPKGMGLGADKIAKPKTLIPPRSDEILEIKKNANIRILAGKFKDLYGQIEGLDDDSGRVIVKLAIGGNRESLNEFMVQPVSKQEYLKFAKVLNSVKYQEYKVKDEIQVKESPEYSTNSREGTSRKENDEIRYEERKNNNKEIERVSKTNQKDHYEHCSTSESEDDKIVISKAKKYHKERRRSRSKQRYRDESSDNSDYEKEKKKSHKSHKIKSKKNRSRSRDDRKRNTSDDEKYHKKKTKKSKKPRSRSKTRK